MVIVMIANQECNVPESVTNIDAFLEWKHSDDIPERGHIWWLQGNVWIDPQPEDIFSHVLIKGEFCSTLLTAAKNDDLGLYLTSGALIANLEADISGEPDGLFMSNASIGEKRVEFIDWCGEGYSVVQGSPDMVLKIVSRSSLTKDTVTLRKAYWEAGIKEYWLVDARKTPASFDILRHTSRGYQAARKQDGWIKSSVFGKSFKLVQTITDLKLPECSLEIR